jgi:hypothetical protein
MYLIKFYWIGSGKAVDHLGLFMFGEQRAKHHHGETFLSPV